MVSNTLFKKEDEKRITYKSGGAKTQIYYILMRRNGGVKVTDCKVIPGEACLTQHRLVCSDLRVEGMKSNKRKKGEEIKQWKLREETVRKKFDENVRMRREENNGGWEKLRDNIIDAGR